MNRRLYKAAALVAAVAAVLVVSYFAIDAVREPESELTSTFNLIYEVGSWGKDASGNGTSGTGSTLEVTREYRAYVEDFIRKHGVKSVVDAGCGDWAFSSAIDWGGASYLGIDIASDVVKRVRRKYEKNNVTFQVGDITEELPAADLLISKDVLQHLSNELVQKFIRNNLKPGKYKWALLTNDRGSENRDIQPGYYRLIDLSAPPFDVKGLVDLPIKFGDQSNKITSLLDLTKP